MAEIPNMTVTVEVEPAFVGLVRIAAERRRQVITEGFDAAHDAAHTAGELLRAAACYIVVARYLSLGWSLDGARGVGLQTWPWGFEWFKPSADPVRNLEKAGALIAAELDRLAAAPAWKSDP